MTSRTYFCIVCLSDGSLYRPGHVCGHPCDLLEEQRFRLLPEGCRRWYILMATSTRPSARSRGRCSCGDRIGTSRVLDSPRHVELAASQLAVDGLIPPTSWETAAILIRELGSLNDAVDAVRDMYGWTSRT